MSEHDEETAPPARSRVAMLVAQTAAVRATAPVWAGVAAVVALGALILSQLSPSDLLSTSTPTGGDMGAHVWLPNFIREHVLAKGRVTGWTPDWYAGFPAGQFYFPLPTLLIIAVDALLPYEVAFKLVAVLGAVALPASVWFFGRRTAIKTPGPELMAAATVPFLFDQFHTIYGGNLPSVLAGMFSESLGIALAFVFLGVFAGTLDSGHRRGLAATLFAAAALAHMLAGILAGAGAVALLLAHLDLPRAKRFVTTVAPGCLLTAFWAVPFIAARSHTNDMGWEKITDLSWLLPFASKTLPDAQTQHFLPITVLAALGAVIALPGRSAGPRAVVILAAIFGGGFVAAPQGPIWNARLLPFWYLTLYLLAAFALASAVRVCAAAMARRAALPAGAVIAGAALVAVALLPLRILPSWVPGQPETKNFVPAWASWNFSGYEAKDAWPEYNGLMDTMKFIGSTHGCGRAMWEYDEHQSEYGTPMALMLLPYWTDGCIGSMEGLYFESSATTPYHFMNQAWLSAKPSSAMRDLPYESLNLDKGLDRLRLLGVQYYMARSTDAVAAANERGDLELVATSTAWHVYKVTDVALVEPIAPPVVAEGPGAEPWLDLAMRWYSQYEPGQRLLAEDGPKNWERIDVQLGAGTRTRGSAVRYTPAKPEPAPRLVVSDITTDDDEVRFRVSEPGHPILVKVSDFPAWKVDGARGPWRVAPNLMVVVPTEEEVRLHFGRTGADLAGLLLTATAAAALAAPWVRHRLRHRTRPQI